MQKNHHILNEKSYVAIAFISILIIFFILTISYSIYTPAFKTADRQYHFNFPRLILEEKIDYNQGHNPLYYLILAGFLNFVDHPESTTTALKHKDVTPADEVFPYSGTAFAIHILRFFSIFCGVITLIFSYKIAKLIFVNEKWLPIFVMSFIAFIPQFTFVTSALNNDVLVWPLATISLYYLIKYTKEPEKIKFLFLLALFGGLAYLTKSNALVLIPIFFTTSFYLLYSKQIHKKLFLKNNLAYVSVFLIGGGWNALYKLIIGESTELTFLHFKTKLASAITETSSSSDMIYLIEGFSRITNWNSIFFRFIDRLWATVWGDIGAPRVYAGIAELILTIGLVGLFLFFVRKDISKIKIEKNYLIVLFSSVGFMLILSTSFMFFIGSGVARNTFPIISMIGILLSLGLYVFVERSRLKYLLILLILFFIVMNINSIILINEIYNPEQSSFYSKNEPFKSLLQLYNLRPDIQNVFPEVANGDITGLLNWAKNYGAIEKGSLNSLKPLFDLIIIYYSSPDLQKSFPEVSQSHNIENLLDWAIETGVNQNPTLKNHKDFFIDYREGIQLSE